MAEEYKGIKLPALRKIAEEKGLEDYEDLERNELIEALENADEESEEELEDEETEEVEEEETEEPKSPIITGVSVGKAPEGSKAAAMKRNLDSQPKISILIPLEGDKVGSTFPVTLNGLRLNILKGMYVSVPKQVAEIVMNSQNQTREALEGPMRKLAHDGLPMKLDGDIGALSR